MSIKHIITMIPKKYYPIIIILLLSNRPVVVDGQSLFRFDSGSPLTGADDFGPLLNNSALIWQPLRATFRPLNRPTPPIPPTPPTPPPEPLTSFASSADFDSSFLLNDGADLATSRIAPADGRSGSSDGSSRRPAPLSSFFPVDRVLTAAATSLTTFATTPASNLDDEDLPTRVPLNRFRPTKPPSIDAQAQPGSGASLIVGGAASGSQSNSANNNNNSNYRITNECFECICEASTSCNPNSRCQTSDVRHTRCGMMLISYDQWLDTGLSKQLVTREALARDAAADERAFYECVTDRSCAERVMAAYMQKNAKDCDKDGHVNCYDVAAIHQGGTDRCQSEALLESQYWSDFSACFGFGR